VRFLFYLACLILHFRFKLPSKIEFGKGSLNCTVEYKGRTESTSQTIPILLQNVKVTFYPESGDLIANIPSNIYIEAFTPSGSPADLMGEIVDAKGVSCGVIQTLHEGRGKGTFTPQKGKKYFLKINTPSGITAQNPLPEVKDEGIVISAKKFVTDANSPLLLSLFSSKPAK